MASNGRNFVGADGKAPPFKYFFKAISQEAITDQKLMIPEKFACVFKEKLPDVARLKGPDDIVWRVGLSRERGSDRRVWLESGFGEFLRSYSIVARDLLMFRYDGSSGFKVIICDDTACEVVYRNAEPQVSSSEEDSDGDDMDDSEFDSYDESNDEDDVVEVSDSESESRNPRQNIRSANGKGKEVETGHRPRGADASGSRRRVTRATNRAAGTAAAGQGHKGEQRRLAAEDSDDSSSDGDWRASRGKAQRDAAGDGASGSRHRRKRSSPAARVAQTGSGIDGALWRRLVASKITFNLHFARLSCGGLRAVKQAMDCYNSKRPSMLIAIKATHISGKRLNIPTKFANTYFAEDPEEIMLRAYEGKTQFMDEMLAYTSRPILNLNTLYLRRWNKFCLMNDLVVGDVCLLELVSTENKAFNIHIFRA